MNSEELYERMKQAWDFLGVGFHGKHLVTVTIEGQFLVLTDPEGDAVRIKL